MLQFLKLTSLFFILSIFSQHAWSDQAYIKIGEAQAKKSNLAFPVFNQINTHKSSQNVKVAAEIHKVTTEDLEKSTYFKMMSSSAFLENTSTTPIKSKAMDPSGFKFDTWKSIEADFLIRASFSLIGDDISIELYLYQVNEGKTVVGKKYNGKTNQTVQIGHIIANDILEALTGQRGSFLSKIVATTDRTGHKEVITLNQDGSEQNLVTRDRSVAISPNWSPDARKVVYSIYTRKIGSAQMNLTLFEQDLASGKRMIISNRNGLNSGASYSPDGKHIYLTISQSGAPDIFKITSKGEIVSQLTKGPAGAMNVEAALSKDGSKIAFSSDRGGKPMIYVMSSDGSNVKRLTFEGKYNSTPSWSPDGKKIAFASMFENYFDIFIMDSDGANIKRLTTATKANGKRASNEDPSFSPDGRFIVFSSNRSGSFQLYTISVDGTEERRITNDSHNYYKPKWSNNLE